MNCNKIYLVVGLKQSNKSKFLWIFDFCLNSVYFSHTKNVGKIVSGCIAIAYFQYLPR